MRRNRLGRMEWLTWMLLALASPSLAVDGRLEINQACADTGGCFAGDSAGFPVTLSKRGASYVLTSDLSRTLNPLIHQTIPFIQITAADVTLDLNGGQNIVGENLGGTVLGPNNTNMGGNVCDNSATCP